MQTGIQPKLTNIMNVNEIQPILTYSSNICTFLCIIDYEYKC